MLHRIVRSKYRCDVATQYSVEASIEKCDDEEFRIKESCVDRREISHIFENLVSNDREDSDCEKTHHDCTDTFEFTHMNE